MKIHYKNIKSNGYLTEISGLGSCWLVHKLDHTNKCYIKTITDERIVNCKYSTGCWVRQYLYLNYPELTNYEFISEPVTSDNQPELAAHYHNHHIYFTKLVRLFLENFELIFTDIVISGCDNTVAIVSDINELTLRIKKAIIYDIVDTSMLHMPSDIGLLSHVYNKGIYASAYKNLLYERVTHSFSVFPDTLQLLPITKSDFASRINIASKFDRLSGDNNYYQYNTGVRATIADLAFSDVVRILTANPTAYGTKLTQTCMLCKAEENLVVPPCQCNQYVYSKSKLCCMFCTKMKVKFEGKYPCGCKNRLYRKAHPDSCIQQEPIVGPYDEFDPSH